MFVYNTFLFVVGNSVLCEILGSHGTEYEDNCLLGCFPDDGISKHV
jgi:hypothetical protein